MITITGNKEQITQFFIHGLLPEGRVLNLSHGDAIELRDLLLREFPVEGEQQPAEPALSIEQVIAAWKNMVTS